MVMKGTKPPSSQGSLTLHKLGGTKAGCVIGMSGQGQRGVVRNHPAVPHRAREPLLRRTCGSFWENQGVRAHRSFLFLRVMSLQLIWGPRVNIVAQQPVLFQKHYCNTECPFVVPVFCSTHQWVHTHSLSLFLQAADVISRESDSLFVQF